MLTCIIYAHIQSILIIHGSYKVVMNPVLANSESLLLGELQGLVPVGLWSQHIHQKINT